MTKRLPFTVKVVGLDTRAPMYYHFKTKILAEKFAARCIELGFKSEVI